MFQHFELQPGQNRQTRPEDIVLVLERRLHLNGAAGEIDLVVDDRQVTFGKRLGPIRRERPDRHLTRIQSFVDTLYMLFRGGEHDRNRLQFHDRDDPVRVSRVNNVAWVDLPKSNSSSER